MDRYDEIGKLIVAGLGQMAVLKEGDRDCKIMSEFFVLEIFAHGSKDFCWIKNQLQL